MGQKVLIDSSGLVAFMDRRSSAHSAVGNVIDSAEYSIVIPATTIPETAYVVAGRLGHSTLQLFVQDITANSALIENLTVVDYQRSAELLQTYADLRLDFVDASIAALAERLNITHILTLDRRDFRVLRPKHCSHFELLP